MILFEKALEIVLNEAFLTDIEHISILNSLNRVLAEDVKSDMNMPPFDKSAMDGYACRLEDILNPLTLIETIPAGKLPEMSIYKNECSKIMTGAKIPEGADCVLMVEDTVILENGNIQFKKSNTNKNICFVGEDIRENQKVLPKGTLIKPQHVAILSAVGCVNPLVYKQPRVGVIATGDELVEPDQKPQGGQIRNSNGFQLYMQCLQSGAIPNYYGIVKDNESESIALLSKALNENDLVILSGGVSMGDFDFVGSALEKNGIRILFDSVAVQPGKPTTFGVGERKLCFGMPGNPVSSYIQFEIMAKPLIHKMMGKNDEPGLLFLPLKNKYSRKKSDRMAIVPANITSGAVEPSEYHGSAHIFSLGYSNCIMFVPLGINELKQGDFVHVRPI